jgi:hypothetical protein
VCTGFLPDGTTPVAYISSHDTSGGGVSCVGASAGTVMRGLRYGYRLSQILEELLAGL